MRIFLFFCLIFLVACVLQSEEAFVNSIIDGDTLITSAGTVRLIGIDAPEEGECGYKSAKDRLAELTEDKKIRLVPDYSQGNRDKYGRLLRYVELEENDIGADLLREGYVQVFPWFDVERFTSYQKIADTAKARGSGPLYKRCSPLPRGRG